MAIMLKTMIPRRGKGSEANALGDDELPLDDDNVLGFNTQGIDLRFLSEPEAMRDEDVEALVTGIFPTLADMDGFND